MNSEQLYYLTALNSLVLSKPLYNLKERFGSVRNVFSASYDDLVEVHGVGPVVAERIRSFDLEMFARKEEDLIKKEGVSIVTIEDESYPEQLKTIFDPPSVLYIQGELKKEDDLSLAIVGSRKPTQYGKAAVQRLTSEIAEKGLTVVSGMARGIDSLAHKSALSVGKRTIAILGCGVNVVYPAENKKLKDDIASHGAVISEFAMSTKPERMNFPRRNRIISGLSLGTLVIEAAAKSGTLITAEFALEQGREVFAVPGNIGAPNSHGCNTLIKMGAKLVAQGDDIVAEFPLHIQEQLKPKGFSIECKNIHLSKGERNVMASLKEEGRHIDDLVREINIPPAQLLNILTRLEVIGVVKQLKGKIFISLVYS